MIDYSKLLSKKAVSIKPSGIRKFFDLADGDDSVISLGVGEPDFKTPWVVRREGIRTLEKGNTWYGANAGLFELREGIAGYLERRLSLTYDPKDEIVVTVGGSEGIDLCVRALIEPGDEVMIVEPCFVAYAPMVELMGGKVVPLVTKSENSFKLTPGELKKNITDRTKLLVLPYPNNPTGGIMTGEDLEGIADVLRGTNILVLSDEIYSELTYGRAHASIAQLPGMKERTVIVNGFSKAYAMTGWRMGYAAGPKEIISQMLKIHQFAIMCAPRTSQFAALCALKECDDVVAYMREDYNTRRRFVVDSLNKMGLPCFEPEGAFYVFPDIRPTGLSSEEFCTRLLRQEKVAVVPGDAFGASGEGFVRISYCYSIKHLTLAMKKMKVFVDSLK